MDQAGDSPHISPAPNYFIMDRGDRIDARKEMPLIADWVFMGAERTPRTRTMDDSLSGTYPPGEVDARLWTFNLSVDRAPLGYSPQIINLEVCELFADSRVGKVIRTFNAAEALELYKLAEHRVKDPTGAAEAVAPERKDIRQVVDGWTNAGIAINYNSEFLAVAEVFKKYGLPKTIDRIVAQPIQTYVEVYPPAQYYYVITPANEVALTRIETIVKELNRSAKKGTLTEARYKDLHVEATMLIYGEKKL